MSNYEKQAVQALLQLRIKQNEKEPELTSSKQGRETSSEAATCTMTRKRIKHGCPGSRRKVARKFANKWPDEIEMIRLMAKYGPETNTVDIWDISTEDGYLIELFKAWNPSFMERFVLTVDGTWRARAGDEKELEIRRNHQNQNAKLFRRGVTVPSIEHTTAGNQCMMHPIRLRLDTGRVVVAWLATYS